MASGLATRGARRACARTARRPIFVRRRAPSASSPGGGAGQARPVPPEAPTHAMAAKPPSRARAARARAATADRPTPDSANAGVRIDWRRVAYHVLVSRRLDDAEEGTNRNRATTPKEHQVLYQFSARGHEVGQVILGTLLDRPHDAAGAYYRSRPLLLAAGLSIEEALASPLGRAGGFSDGRDIGVVCNLPNAHGLTVLPMAGDVGSQYTPAAGWAQAIGYHRDVLGDAEWDGCLAVALGGEG